MPGTTAADRIRLALTEGGKTKGFRGPKGQRQMVELVASDVLEVCRKISTADEVAESQLKGCGSGDPHRTVVIYADHAFRLLDLLDGVSVENDPI